MNNYNQQRPQVSQVPAQYQMEFAAYLQSRRSDWGTAEGWLAWRTANSGVAVKVTTPSPGTTRTEGTLAPVQNQSNALPAPRSTEVKTMDLGQRPVSSVWPRHGVALGDEQLNSHGEPTTKSATVRTDAVGVDPQ
jgi:hypothetical protein